MPAKNKKGKRYSTKRRENLLAKFNELRHAGKSTEDAAKQLHVPYQTLFRWRQGGSAGPKRAALKAAVASARRGRRRGPGRPSLSVAGKRGGLTLVTPAGFRIEGISGQELIRVLKALK